MPARDTVSNRIPEWKLQAAIASRLDSLIALYEQHGPAPFAYAAALEGVIGNLNRYQTQLATATGMKAGEPDLRLYFEAGRLVLVELKGENGRLNDAQKERIPLLRGLGFTVHVLFATTEDEAREAIGVIVAAELASPGGSASLPSARYFPKVRN